MTASAAPSQSGDELRRTAAAVQRAVRRHNTTENQLGPKAVRTRQALLDAAADVFAERGFADATTQEITRRAGTSLATFYQYFADVVGVVAALAGERIVELLEQRVDTWEPRTGRLGLRRLVAAFVHGYLDNVDFYRLWEQASVSNPAMAAMRREFWSAYKTKVEQSLRAGVDCGVVGSHLDPADLARALLHLLDRYCHDVTIGDPPDPPPDRDDLIDFLTTVWAEVLCLTERPQLPAVREVAQ